MLDIIEMDCNGLRLEQVQGSEGHTGTSTTGNSGRRFFSNEVVPAIKNLVDKKPSRGSVEGPSKLYSMCSVL